MCCKYYLPAFSLTFHLLNNIFKEKKFLNVMQSNLLMGFFCFFFFFGQYLLFSVQEMFLNFKIVQRIFIIFQKLYCFYFQIYHYNPPGMDFYLWCEIGIYYIFLGFFDPMSSLPNGKQMRHWLREDMILSSYICVLCDYFSIYFPQLTPSSIFHGYS